MFFLSSNSFKKEIHSTGDRFFSSVAEFFYWTGWKKFCKELETLYRKACLIWLASLVDWLYLLCCVLWRGTGGGGSSGRVDPPPHPPPHSTLARPQQEKKIGKRTKCIYCTYPEYHSVYLIVRNGTPPAPLPQASVSPPGTKGGRNSLRLRGGCLGGVLIRTTAEKPCSFLSTMWVNVTFCLYRP